MLVLSRARDERIIVGHGLVTITIVEIRPGKVRIGIDAPKELAIHREEIERIISEQSEGETP